jgi:hypothetical protein
VAPSESMHSISRVVLVRDPHQSSSTVYLQLDSAEESTGRRLSSWVRSTDQPDATTLPFEVRQCDSDGDDGTPVLARGDLGIACEPESLNVINRHNRYSDGTSDYVIPSLAALTPMSEDEQKRIALRMRERIAAKWLVNLKALPAPDSAARGDIRFAAGLLGVGARVRAAWGPASAPEIAAGQRYWALQIALPEAAELFLLMRQPELDAVPLDVATKAALVGHLRKTDAAYVRQLLATDYDRPAGTHPGCRVSLGVAVEAEEDPIGETCGYDWLCSSKMWRDGTSALVYASWRLRATKACEAPEGVLGSSFVENTVLRSGIFRLTRGSVVELSSVTDPHYFSTAVGDVRAFAWTFRVDKAVKFDGATWLFSRNERWYPASRAHLMLHADASDGRSMEYRVDESVGPDDAPEGFTVRDGALYVTSRAKLFKLVGQKWETPAPTDATLAALAALVHKQRLRDALHAGKSDNPNRDYAEFGIPAAERAAFFAP